MSPISCQSLNRANSGSRSAIKEVKHPKNWETALWGKVRLYWKKGFIERKALLKERLYWKKGLIETNSKIWSKFQNLVQVLKFGWNSEIWPNIWNFAKNVKFGGNSEIWLKFWNLVKILKFGWNSEIWSKFWNLA